MEHSLLQYVRARLAEIRPSDYQAIADACGVPVSTIRKVHYGEVDNPRINTVQALHNYFRKVEKRAA